MKGSRQPAKGSSFVISIQSQALGISFIFEPRQTSIIISIPAVTTFEKIFSIFFKAKTKIIIQYSNWITKLRLIKGNQR